MFKKLLLSLSLVVASAYGQNCTPSASPIFSQQDQTNFNRAYWAAQPPALAALQGLNNQTATQQTALVTAAVQSGYPLDTQILLWSWDPYNTMLMRTIYGYTWVPSFGQPNVPVAPCIAFPGLTSYDPNNPPVGSIRVSLNTSDYPPFSAPVTPTVPTISDPVGARQTFFGGTSATGDWFSVVYGDTTPLNATVTDSRGTFKKTAVGGPFVIGGAIPVVYVKQ